MSAWPTVVVVVAFGAFAVFLGVLRQKASNDAWRDAARELGISFSPAGLFQTRWICGRLMGTDLHVEMHTRGRDTSPWTLTHFRVEFPHNLGLGLQLTRAGPAAALGRFVGSQNIETGDANFDDEIAVNGDDPERVQAFLTTARRDRISRVMRTFSRARIDDESISCSRRGIVFDTVDLVGTAHELVRVAHEIADPEGGGALDEVLEA